MGYTELHRKFDEIREFARKHACAVVTATQPPRGGTGLSPEELSELAKKPIIIDYIGCIRSVYEI